MPRLVGNLPVKLGFGLVNSPATMNFRGFSHSASSKEFEQVSNTEPTEPSRNNRPFDAIRSAGLFDRALNTRPSDAGPNSWPNRMGRPSRSMNLVRGIMEENRGDSHFPRYSVEQNADIVHIKLKRNNTYVTVTDSKGNKKIGASAGCLSEMKGGPKASRYGAEATAEHIGRLARSMGLKSAVLKVNGFTHFKRKKQAILSFRAGYTNSRNDQNPVVYIEDTTRKAHNGCRLRKKRRV